jgi:hypothetical protein
MMIIFLRTHRESRDREQPRGQEKDQGDPTQREIFTNYPRR